MALFSNLGNYKNFGLLIIRVGLGVMFIYHGLPMLMGGPKGWAELGSATKYIGIHSAPAFFGLLSAVTETFGGFLLILGLVFRPVCLLLLINLVVAAALHFGKGDGIDGAAHAIEDAVVFAGLFFAGPGRNNIDKK
jgi:putative oxidoreductase